ncbi:MAG: hypothetical protein M3356_01445 [Actinomycetota bacterium]|nr:hypothetical protein [Actinomycetota bacterium]
MSAHSRGEVSMSGRRRNEVIETAVRTATMELRAPSVSAVLADLPQGQAHKIARPEGPPDAWPEMVPAARGRKAAA